MTTPITLLFDLDGTLLDSNFDQLVPVYFQKLSAYLAHRVQPELLLKYLMVGTRAMMTTDSPTVTLRDAFNRNFYPHLGVDYESVQPEIEKFYDDVFPTLRELTRPIPGVVEFMDWAFAAGHRIAIATNPLFPKKAIQHRLRWAGLPPEKYPFAYVPSYELSHFSKPQAAYYAEVMGVLGWPHGPVVMIGNDVEQDLIPAASLGLATFHTFDTAQPHEFDSTGRGYIKDLRAFLESTPLDSLQPNYTSPASCLAQLLSTPAVLASLLDAVPSPAWTRPPREGEWSLTEILCHLRDSEREVDQPRIETILSQDDPFIPGASPDMWAAQRDYNGQDGNQALADFTASRLETLETLARLATEQWSRKARHAIFGPTSLREMVAFNAEHDRLHIQQVHADLSTLD